MQGIFIDFSKAFDTFDHDILINKLVNLKLGTNAIQWIKNYLSNRKQLTKIKTSFSNTELITCGVPQGSILGPTLFLVYVNDLCKSLTRLKPILFADDTSLFIESKNLNEIIPVINSELASFYNWCVKKYIDYKF